MCYRQLSGAHATARHDGVMAGVLHGLGELAQVGDLLGEHQAVAAAGQGCGCIGGDQAGPA